MNWNSWLNMDFLSTPECLALPASGMQKWKSPAPKRLKCRSEWRKSPLQDVWHAKEGFEGVSAPYWMMSIGIQSSKRASNLGKSLCLLSNYHLKTIALVPHIHCQQILSQMPSYCRMIDAKNTFTRWNGVWGRTPAETPFESDFEGPRRKCIPGRKDYLCFCITDGRGFAGLGGPMGLGEEHHLERWREIRTQRALFTRLKCLDFIYK